MTIYNLDVLLSQFGNSLLFMLNSNCCFLTCKQASQKAGKVFWYSPLFKNSPQFVVIHTKMCDFAQRCARFLFTRRCRNSIQSTKTRLGADCGSDHDLLIAILRLKLKKVGKTTRPFRYDLNQIPHDYTVEVTNRLKGLALTDKVLEEL